jgi:hypothetical protein
MFSRTRSDMVATLAQMIDKAVPACKYDQSAARETVRSWIENDSRFDPKEIGMTSHEVVKEAFDARQTGRAMRLGPAPLELSPMAPYYTGR